MNEPTHYRCRCGEFFPIPEAVIETYREQSEAWGQVAFHTKEVRHCPSCNADDLEEAYDDDGEEQS